MARLLRGGECWLLPVRRRVLPILKGVTFCNRSTIEFATCYQIHIPVIITYAKLCVQLQLLSKKKHRRLPQNKLKKILKNRQTMFYFKEERRAGMRKPISAKSVI